MVICLLLQLAGDIIYTVKQRCQRHAVTANSKSQLNNPFIAQLLNPHAGDILPDEPDKEGNLFCRQIDVQPADTIFSTAPLEVTIISAYSRLPTGMTSTFMMIDSFILPVCTDACAVGQPRQQSGRVFDQDLGVQVTLDQYLIDQLSVLFRKAVPRFIS